MHEQFPHSSVQPKLASTAVKVPTSKNSLPFPNADLKVTMLVKVS